MPQLVSAMEERVTRPLAMRKRTTCRARAGEWVSRHPVHLCGSQEHLQRKYAR